MGDPLQHAESSARKFGGIAADYIEIHKIMDSSKLFLADWRHRAIMHNTFGVHLMENWIIGTTFIRESDGGVVCTRTVVTQHIMEDLNMVPTLGEFLREMPLRRWMMRATPKEVERMKNMTFGEETQGITVTESHEKEVMLPIQASVTWNPGTEDPPTHGWYIIDKKSAAACVFSHNFPALYFYHKKWYADSQIIEAQPTPAWWASFPVDPVLD